MIIEKTARRLGVKFFKEQGYPKLAKMVEDHLCIDGLFGVAVKLIRKKKLNALPGASKVAEDLLFVLP